LENIRGAVIHWENLSYDLILGPGRSRILSFFGAHSRDLRVLDNVYGDAYPGELCCILGESGSGKTTLIDILAGFEKMGEISGTVLIDGNRRPHNFKYQTGYVLQNDAMLGTLTVEEQLMYSAELRLPSDVSRADKQVLISETMKDLGIHNRRNTLIGSPERRGISGGELKRVSIATELVSQPRVLFLDEPTSGLDSARALSVMRLLKQLATKLQQTVICSIHQPRSNIFQLFDRVILLSRGRVVYSGARKDIIKFFRDNGYKCPKGFNHADFLSTILIHFRLSADS
jgi:ABC-type multidrug transport system ATPase subunit